jgi:hypothetical protein
VSPRWLVSVAAGVTQIEDSIETAEGMRHRIGGHLGEPDRAAVVILDSEMDITDAKLVGGETSTGSDTTEPIGDASSDT